ncbi:MAG: zinc protease, partial [Acidobacteriota bacterium]|nr:zinc protease [Acidobacteriota bacterium]
MRRNRLLVWTLAVAMLAPSAALAQRKGAQKSPTAKSTVAASSDSSDILPSIKFTEFRLANGLRVVLHEDHSTPIVGVNIWYHVGSKNETPGKTGYAHLFEHMMFQGSKHVASDAHFRILEGAGASLINGTTDFDRTNYFET